MLVGAHVSAAGGLFKAIDNALDIGANCFALFIRSQRKWVSPPMSDAEVEKFTMPLKASNIKPEHVIVHGSYLINLANPDISKRHQSLQGLIDEMSRCSKLNLPHYNIHPGSAVDGVSVEEAIANVAACINNAHESCKVTVLIETMAGQGTSIGSTFEEVRQIIDLVKVKDLVGVCLDTCHIFAAGYDIRSQKSYDETMGAFDKIIGMKYLKAIHLNDSKGELGCRKDRHEQIGVGAIGMDCFKFLMSDSRLKHVPMILETPDPEMYKQEIALLHSLSI
jgi:apurinic endonuclease APN1